MKPLISTNKSITIFIDFIYRRLLLTSVHKLLAQVVFGIVCFCFLFGTLACIYLGRDVYIYVDSLIMRASID